MKQKSTAAILAIFLGGVGGHKFYLGETGSGLFYLLFCWTLIPSILGVIQGLNLLGMSQAAFDTRYNGRPALVGYGFPGLQQSNNQNHNNIVVNVAAPVAHAAAPHAAPQQAQVGDMAAKISALHELKTSGALTEAEFTAAKQRLLMTSGGS